MVDAAEEVEGAVGEAGRCRDDGGVAADAARGDSDDSPGGAAEPRGRSGSGFGYGPELLDEMTTTKVVHWSPLP